MCISKAEAKDILWGWGKAHAGQRDQREPLPVSQVKRWDVPPGGGFVDLGTDEVVNPYFLLVDDALKRMGDRGESVFYDYAWALYVNTLPREGAQSERVIYAIEKICAKHKLSAKQYEKMVTVFWVKVTAVLDRV